MQHAVRRISDSLSGLQDATKAIKKTSGKARNDQEHMRHVVRFLSHAARIRAAADELMQHGLDTEGQAVVDGCCQGEATPAPKARKQKKKRSPKS